MSHRSRAKSKIKSDGKNLPSRQLQPFPVSFPVLQLQEQDEFDEEEMNLILNGLLEEYLHYSL